MELYDLVFKTWNIVEFENGLWEVMKKECRGHFYIY